MPFDNRKTDFDIDHIIEDAIAANLDPTVVEAIDDRGIPRAPNFFTFLTAKKFLGIKPFGKQIQLGTSLFEEACPECSDIQFFASLFDQDTEEIAERVSFLEFGICPRCRKTQHDFLKDGIFVAPNELNVCAGMRSGKTTTTAMIMLYHLHRCLMTRPSPAKYFKLLPRQTLQFTFSAVTAGQAYDTLWTSFTDLYEESRWYQNYEQFLEEQEKDLGKGSLYSYQDTYLWFGHKRLIVYFAGTDIRTIRGRTRVASAVDELGWFDAEAESQRVRMNAYETYNALTRSLRTVRSAADKKRKAGQLDVRDGISVNISSPSADNDMIMRLVRDEHPRRISYHFATWEMNPDITYEELQQEATDQRSFDRDYGAIPPLANDPFIIEDLSGQKMHKIVSDRPQTALATWQIKESVDDFGNKSMWVEVTPRAVDKTTPRILCVDTGFSQNCFGIGLFHYEHPETTIGDFFAEAEPYSSDGAGVAGQRVVVNFPKMFEHCIMPLVENFGVLVVLYDRYASFHQVQLLREKGIEAIQVSARWKDFVETRVKMESGQFKIPKPEISINQFRQLTTLREHAVRGKPVLHLLLQIFTVRQVGKNVVKPLNGTDDLWRPCVLAAHYMYIEKQGPRLASKARRKRGGHNTVGVMQYRNVGLPQSQIQRAPTFTSVGATSCKRPKRVI